MIDFHCRHCNQHIRVDDSHAGRSARCPTCKEAIVIPPNTRVPEDVLELTETPTKDESLTLFDSTRKCPFCAEQIKKDAVKCKHCGEWLNASGTDKHSQELRKVGDSGRIKKAKAKRTVAPVPYRIAMAIFAVIAIGGVALLNHYHTSNSIIVGIVLGLALIYILLHHILKWVFRIEMGLPELDVHLWGKRKQ